ncbi:ribosomal-processing cysteine protease Prp [Pectinatus frisingensis]|uniref:ribosomal-processing cysteine protease Prp n=1 Tax=Pectinatus frisingensis TaxID=865 RepID=UPI0018C5D423|nr:ribosomal-processing cysteine protease Prp [Pectinatus frisingensis]
MIDITIHYSSSKINGLLIKGHANAGEYGMDIVCAAVSALAQSVILSLTKHLHFKINYDVKAGYLRINLQDAPTELTEAIFSVAVLGFMEISQKNPDNVAISTTRG